MIDRLICFAAGVITGGGVAMGTLLLFLRYVFKAVEEDEDINRRYK